MSRKGCPSIMVFIILCDNLLFTYLSFHPDSNILACSESVIFIFEQYLPHKMYTINIQQMHTILTKNYFSDDETVKQIYGSFSKMILFFLWLMCLQAIFFVSHDYCHSMLSNFSKRNMYYSVKSEKRQLKIKGKKNTCTDINQVCLFMIIIKRKHQI